MGFRVWGLGLGGGTIPWEGGLSTRRHGTIYMYNLLPASILTRVFWRLSHPTRKSCWSLTKKLASSSSSSSSASSSWKAGGGCQNAIALGAPSLSVIFVLLDQGLERRDPAWPFGKSARPESQAWEGVTWEGVPKAISLHFAPMAASWASHFRRQGASALLRDLGLAGWGVVRAFKAVPRPAQAAAAEVGMSSRTAWVNRTLFEH